jgi:hypothetical protein
LAKLLADKAALLVLDDVWTRLDVNAFDVLGPRCRALITTRDTGILESLGGAIHGMGLLTEAEALDLLALGAEVERECLPSEAAQVVAECGRLPLALALCGGLVRRGVPWGAVLRQLQQNRIDRFADRHAVELQHQSVWHAINASVMSLPAEERRRFLELAAFPPDEPIPVAAIGKLWEGTGQLDQWATDKLLTALSQKSLVRFVTQPPDAGQASRQVTLHDLVHDYLRHATPETGSLHD